MIKPQQAVTMWLSLGEADESNGAVCYIPGSHPRVFTFCSMGGLGVSGATRAEACRADA